MTFRVSAEDIIEITGGRLAQGMMPDGSAELSLDSRTLKEGSWFVAVRGQAFDGHDFIGDAYAAGAIGCIVEERLNYPIAENNFPLIAVGDTVHALKDLGRSRRSQLPVKVIAVASGERGQSCRIASMLTENLLQTTSCVEIDLANCSVVDALYSLINLSEEVRILVVNMVPDTIEYASLVMEANCPNICVLIGEPFAYLRLTSRGQDIETTMSMMMASMQSGKGDILTQGEGSYAVACRLKLPGLRIKAFERSGSLPTQDYAIPPAFVDDMVTVKFEEEDVQKSFGSALARDTECDTDSDIISFEPKDEFLVAGLNSFESWILSECRRSLGLNNDVAAVQ